MSLLVEVKSEGQKMFDPQNKYKVMVWSKNEDHFAIKTWVVLVYIRFVINCIHTAEIQKIYIFVFAYRMRTIS